MTKTNGVTALQFFIMTFGFTAGTSILVMPSALVQGAREAGWIAGLVVTVFNLVHVWLYIAIMRLYPGQSVLQIFGTVFGKWAGKLIQVIYLSFILLLCGTLVGNIGFFMSGEMMPETPVEALNILFVAVVCFAVYSGIQVFARLSELIFPLILVFFVALFLLLMPQMNIHYIQPVLEDGPMPVLMSGFQAMMLQETVIVTVLFPLVQNRSKANKALIYGTVLGGVILFMTVLLCLLVAGVEQTSNFTYPAYAVAKMINIGNFLQRIEGMLITIWVLTIFIKCSICFYAILDTTGKLFNMHNPRLLILPFAVLICCISLSTYTNTVYVLDFLHKDWTIYSGFHLTLLPVLLLIAGIVRKKLKPAGQ